ncbi:MAG: hypothetical protein KAS15_07015 [Nanoarchaeota archaeon]|nr:hypothetical protein [Nanoarchaeota archaeon]
MEFADYPLNLSNKTVEEMVGAKVLTGQQKKEWGLWRLSIVERYISIEKGFSVQTVGRPAWAVKNNKKMKTQAIKDLSAQRKILKQYIKDNK